MIEIRVLEVEAFRQLQSGNFQEAETIYCQIIEQALNNAEAYSNLGVAVFYQGRQDEAITYIKKAIEHSPDLAEAYNNLGCILQCQGHLAKSVDYFNKAIALKPNCSTSSTNLTFALDNINSRRAGSWLRAEDGYLTWDPWIFKDGNLYRVFYLIGNPKDAPAWSIGAIGSAISTDLKHWEDCGIVLKPQLEHKWESGRLLAGNVCKEEDIYYLFYSASPSYPLTLEERIGLATSDDGVNWQRSSTPLVEPDSRFYAPSLAFFLAGFINQYHYQWRDPYIIKEPVTGYYYMFISASCQGLNPRFNGCIGLAVSQRINGPYEVLPPAACPILEGTEESIFYEMERPQVIYNNGKYYLFFSAWLHAVNPKWLASVGKDKITNSSIYCYVSDKITGPFKPLTDKPIVKGSEATGLYGTNFFTGPNEELFAYGWRYRSFELQVTNDNSISWDFDNIEIKLDKCAAKNYENLKLYNRGSLDLVQKPFSQGKFIIVNAQPGFQGARENLRPMAYNTYSVDVLGVSE